MSTNASGAKRAHSDEPAERRVLPRYFHAGPSPPAAPSDAHAADGPPPASRLYRHAFESVFAFLGQGELAFALRVSRDWLAAAESMGSLQLKVRRLSAPVCVVAASAMGHHVAAIGTFEEPVALIVDSLHVLALKMPLLRKLVCELSLPPLQAPLTFPAALRELKLSVSDPAVAADINAAIQTISRLPLLESLAITVTALDPQLSFAPLAAMPRLRALAIWRSCDEGEISDAQLDQLRSLHRLRSFTVCPMTVALLRRLLRQPHNLQWQRIRLFVELDVEAAALLPQLPSLTEIKGWPTCSRFDWLRGLPNLTDVNLSFDGSEEAGRGSSMVAGLQSCAGIEKLTFCQCADLTAAHLAELLSRLPRLHSLKLECLDIDSLSFLAQPPMTSQLTSLYLSYCDQMPLAELRHVHSLRSLKKMELWYSFTTPMDDYCQSLYEPPSLLVPSLEQFSYSAPEEQDVDSDDDD